VVNKLGNHSKRRKGSRFRSLDDDWLRKPPFESQKIEVAKKTTKKKLFARLHCIRHQTTEGAFESEKADIKLAKLMKRSEKAH
jgi:hypothetical protein